MKLLKTSDIHKTISFCILTPDEVDRYSLALYYFTDEIPESEHHVIFYYDEDLGVNKKDDNIFKTN